MLLHYVAERYVCPHKNSLEGVPFPYVHPKKEMYEGTWRAKSAPIACAKLTVSQRLIGHRLPRLIPVGFNVREAHSYPGALATHRYARHNSVLPIDCTTNLACPGKL